MCAGDVVVAVDGKKARGEAATALLQQGAAKSTRRLRVRRQEARAPPATRAGQRRRVVHSREPLRSSAHGGQGCATASGLSLVPDF